MRSGNKSSYTSKLRVYPDGQINVGLSKTTNGVEKILGSKKLGIKAGTSATPRKVRPCASGQIAWRCRASAT